MKEVILIRFGEIFLKGKNYFYFENTLFKNISWRLSKFKLNLIRTDGRFIVSDFNEVDKDEIIKNLKCVFGIVSISVASEIDTSLENIYSLIKNIKIVKDTFKVEVNRADKKFPVKSPELSRELGHMLLENNKGVSVDVHNPKQVVNVEIRPNNKTYIYFDKIECLGGMPVGTAGESMLLLSGGIDSPVAGFLMAKRGLKISAIHFYSYPYTSEQAKQKVIDLTNIIKNYTGDIKLYIVPFTKIQEEIHKKCDDEYMVTIVRRFMMDIAERVAKSNGCNSLITGENLAQVASQTVEGITSTNKMAKDLVVFRPLIGFDKVEISKIAEKIGTYETSILPYEDCCSVFLPKKPVTHPKLERVEKNEQMLDIERLIKEAVESVEILNIKL